MVEYLEYTLHYFKQSPRYFFMTTLPIFNLAPLFENPPQPLSDGSTPPLASYSHAKLIHQLIQTLETSGLLLVQGHGIPLDLQKHLYQASQIFFGLSLEQKKEIDLIHRGKAWRGYFETGLEYTAGQVDLKEGLYFGIDHPRHHPMVQDQVPMHGSNQWPKIPLALKKCVISYMAHARRVADSLLRWIGYGLGLDLNYFEKRFTQSSSRSPYPHLPSDPTCLFRIFHYPLSHNLDLKHSAHSHNRSWGVGEHTDMGFLTLVLQDHVGGLQIKNKTWLDVPSIPNTLVVNLGDMMEMWTWGRLKATLHRVKASQSQSRLSFPFFYDPHWFASLEPIDPALMKYSPLASSRSPSTQRWDGLNLTQLDQGQTYGEFVWNKIRSVFPHLVK